MSEKEYQVFRLNPDKISVLYGAVLIVFAVLVSSISESKSLTSYTVSYTHLTLPTTD